jgi:hypothetical protein
LKKSRSEERCGAIRVHDRTGLRDTRIEVADVTEGIGVARMILEAYSVFEG